MKIQSSLSGKYGPKCSLLTFYQRQCERAAWWSGMLDSLLCLWKVRLQSTLTTSVHLSKQSWAKQCIYFCLHCGKAKVEKKGHEEPWLNSISFLYPQHCDCLDKVKIKTLLYFILFFCMWRGASGVVFLSTASHRRIRCLLVDHFLAMTNVTLLKTTTNIVDRAWQQRWRLKHKILAPG